MKSRDGKSQRREEKRRRKKIKKRKSEKKEDPGARKGKKVAKHCVFPLLRVRSQLARWEMKNCTQLWREARFQVKMYKAPQLWSTFRSCDIEKWTPLWCEAHFQVKMYKALQPRSTFGSWDVQKVYAVVARRTFPSQNVQNTPCSDHFWKLTCRKGARGRGVKHISKSKVSKTPHVRATCVAGARDCAPCQKWAKREGFVAFQKMMAGVRHFKRICKDTFSVAGAVQETCSSEMLGGEGADFLRGVAFGSIRSVGLLRWFCLTGAALCVTWHHFFVAGAVLWTGGVEKSQSALVGGRQLCTQLSIFEGSLAELLRFWCCQLQNWGSVAK